MNIDLTRSRQAIMSDWSSIKSGFFAFRSMFLTLISNKFGKLATIIGSIVIFSCILTFLCGMFYQSFNSNSQLAFSKIDSTDTERTLRKKDFTNSKLVIAKKDSVIKETSKTNETRLIAPTMAARTGHANTHELAAMVKFISQEIIDKSSGGVTDPNKLAYQIVSESLIAGEDPFFVTALILAESTFRTTARSHVGARGLMQIMPATGKYIAKKINYEYEGISSLEDPTTNLRLGISYVQYLKRMFNDNLDEVLVAYNWGPGNVKKRRSPPSSSVKYSNKIQNHHRKWRTSYAKNFHQYKYANIAKLIS